MLGSVLLLALRHFHALQQMPKKKYGTRQEVWAGQATQTRYGLTRKGLMLSKKGKIVSKSMSALAKRKSNLKNHLYMKPIITRNSGKNTKSRKLS